MTIYTIYVFVGAIETPDMLLTGAGCWDLTDDMDADFLNRWIHLVFTASDTS